MHKSLAVVNIPFNSHNYWNKKSVFCANTLRWNLYAQKKIIKSKWSTSSFIIPVTQKTWMKGNDFLCVHIFCFTHLSVLILHLCFVSANLFIYLTSKRKLSTLVNQHLQLKLFFVGNFLLLAAFYTRCFGTLWLISFLLPPFALLQFLRRLFSAMHGYYRDHRCCCEAFVHYFSCQWYRQQNWHESRSSFKMENVQLSS